MTNLKIIILETPQEIQPIEDLQRIIWPGSETEIVPAHLLIAAVHNGGLLMGAYLSDEPDHETNNSNAENKPDHSNTLRSEKEAASLIGFVFGFPGLYYTPDGPRLKHHSHLLGVLPEHRDKGVGFKLKRAQWQMVCHQGLDRITWTFDPLHSRNAYLNISRLGAVCSVYLPDYYGQLQDGLNIGAPSDRFQVDWWINSRRVVSRLSKNHRPPLDLAHYLAAGVQIVNPTFIGESHHPIPLEGPETLARVDEIIQTRRSMVLVEIPADFLSIKKEDMELAFKWRLQTREIFIQLFQAGYIITDFIYLSGKYPRSFYLLSDGEATF